MNEAFASNKLRVLHQYTTISVPVCRYLDNPLIMAYGVTHLVRQQLQTNTRTDFIKNLNKEFHSLYGKEYKLTIYSLTEEQPVDVVEAFEVFGVIVELNNLTPNYETLQ